MPVQNLILLLGCKWYVSFLARKKENAYMSKKVEILIFEEESSVSFPTHNF